MTEDIEGNAPQPVADKAAALYPLGMWDDRYAKPGYSYGTEPNEFLVTALAAHGAGRGRALCLAEGEGRNAVYVATLGYRPLAVDQSSTGLAKAAQLARAQNVEIETLCLDLNDLDYPLDTYVLATSIFGHVPPALRRKVHRGVAVALQRSGILVLEAYHPDNVGRGTGGPQAPELCVTAAALREELDGMEILHLREMEREVNEGCCHQGLAAVTQLVARKP